MVGGAVSLEEGRVGRSASCRLMVSFHFHKVLCSFFIDTTTEKICATKQIGIALAFVYFSSFLYAQRTVASYTQHESCATRLEAGGIEHGNLHRHEIKRLYLLLRLNLSPSSSSSSNATTSRAGAGRVCFALFAAGPSCCVAGLFPAARL